MKNSSTTRRRGRAARRTCSCRFGTARHSRERSRNRTARVRVTNLATNRQKVNVTIPVSLIQVGLRLGTRLVPQVSGSALEDLLRAIESGATGRILDLQDLEEGERVEIFAE